VTAKEQAAMTKQIFGITGVSVGLAAAIVMMCASARPAAASPYWVGAVNAGATKYFTVNLKPHATRLDAEMIGAYFRRFGLVVDDRNTDVVFVRGTYAQAAAAANTSFAVARLGDVNYVHTTRSLDFPRDVAERIVATTLDDGPPMQSAGINPLFTLEGEYGYTPAQIATYYDASSVYSGGNTGQGINIVTIDCGEYSSLALNKFRTTFGFPANAITVVLVDTTTATETPTATFDLENLVEAAPGANITEYVLPADSSTGLCSGTTSEFADALAKVDGNMATDHYAAVADDYSESEDYFESSGEGSVLTAMHTDIQNIFAAGGNVVADTGLWGAGPPPQEASSAGEITVEYPASDPKVIGVGGTSAIPTSTYARDFELGWGGSGGGVSTQFAIGSNQKVVVGLASSTMRNVPDVAYDADLNTCNEVYLQVGGGHVRPEPVAFCDSGTGTGTMAWAGFIALVDEARIAAGKSALAKFQNELYAERNAGIFVTIKKGCNDYYCADSDQYNNVTGLGVPDVAKLVSTFTALP
jgi:subtilase family serine protease